MSTVVCWIFMEVASTIDQILAPKANARIDNEAIAICRPLERGFASEPTLVVDLEEPALVVGREALESTLRFDEDVLLDIALPALLQLDDGRRESLLVVGLAKSLL